MAAKSVTPPSMNAAKQARLRFVDFLLDHVGTVNRAQLEDFFGISTPQASLDLREYLQQAPGNMAYSQTHKAYCRAPKFKRVFP